MNSLPRNACTIGAFMDHHRDEVAVRSRTAGCARIVTLRLPLRSARIFRVHHPRGELRLPGHHGQAWRVARSRQLRAHCLQDNHRTAASRQPPSRIAISASCQLIRLEPLTVVAALANRIPGASPKISTASSNRGICAADGEDGTRLSGGHRIQTVDHLGQIARARTAPAHTARSPGNRPRARRKGASLFMRPWPTECLVRLRMASVQPLRNRRDSVDSFTPLVANVSTSCLRNCGVATWVKLRIDCVSPCATR